jgi:cytochrome c-type biogenesis protein CcmH/NrfG
MQPQNFESWLALGEYDLQHGRPQLALTSLDKATSLNVNSIQGAKDVAQAKAAIAAARANGAAR